MINLARTWHYGMDKMMEKNPEHAEDVMRQLKKGSIGTAFMLMGFYNPQFAGGFYQKNDKRKKGDAKVGQLKIGDWDVPKWMSHVPLFEALQIGSTLRRVSDAKGNDAVDAALAASVGILDSVPFLNEASRLGSLHDPHGPAAFVGDQIKSIVIPASVGYVARQGDTDASGETRKVQTNSLWERLMSEIPGMRNKLKTKQQR